MPNRFLSHSGEADVESYELEAIIGSKSYERLYLERIAAPPRVPIWATNSSR